MTNALDRVRNLAAAQRAELRQRLWENGVATTALNHDQADGEAPASFTQRRMLFLHEANPDSSAYHSCVLFGMSGRLDTEILEMALHDMIVRHAVLRTALVVRAGNIVQLVKPAAPIDLSETDLSDLPVAERDRARDRLAAADQALPFDLAQGAPVRFSLLRMSEFGAELLVTFHHAVIDGWSLSIFIRDLEASYQAIRDRTPVPMPALSLDYLEYARWQQDWLASKEANNQLAYWVQRLHGIGPLPLPADRPRRIHPSFAGDQVAFTISPDTRDRLGVVAAHSGATLFMVLLAGFQVVLARYSGTNDVTVGTPVANRRYAGFHDLMGFFANSVVLHANVVLKQRFCDFLADVRETCLDAYENQDVPLDELVRRLNPDRDLGRNPLYQVNFTLHNTPDPIRDDADLVIAVTHVPDVGARFDLDLNITVAEDGLRCVLVYATDLFDRVTVERLANALGLVLVAVASDPDVTVGELPLMTDADLIDVFSAGRGVDSPTDFLVHELVRQQVESTPDLVAVSAEDGVLTYREMDCEANTLAHRLVAAGVGRGDVVGVLLPRCADLPVALLSVLKAGAAYLPLDPTHPRKRLTQLVRASDARLVITDAATRSLLAGPEIPPTIVCDHIRHGTERPPVVDASPDDPMYVIYTSGSTGAPKGVVVPHRAVANYLQWAARAFDVHVGDSVQLHTSLAVDLTVTSVFAPLLAGARLCPLPEGGAPGVHLLASARAEEGLGFVKLTPSHLRLLASADVADRAARWTRLLVVGGEDLRAEHVIAWQSTPGVPRLINEYGPTETAVACAAFEVSLPLPVDRVPIGSPIPNTRMYVLDEMLRPLPVGAPGELYVGGVGLAHGYHARRAETSARFVSDPFCTAPGSRLYRTGDRARLRNDGAFEYLDRLDKQRKVRGHRIEPGEIEQLLAEHPAVSQCLVDADEDGEMLVVVAVDVPVDSTIEAAQVAQWSTLYEDMYGRGPDDSADRTFDLAGWNSSITGLPIDPVQMRDWLSDTTSRIADLNPRRVLDLGCGTGMILSRIADACEHYVGSDVSAVVVDRLRTRYGRENLELRIQPAHLAVAPGDVFDTVVLNSVIQYFPSITYLLDVLTKAIAAMPAGGHVFVGDVRNLLLLETFHTAVHTKKAPESGLVGDVRGRVRNSVVHEEELCLDPKFFHDLPILLDRVSSVRVLLKRSEYHNELTCYRYDVVIAVDGPAARSVQTADQRDWAGIPDLTELLEQGATDVAAFRAVPNARLITDVEVQQLVSAAPAATRISELVDGAECGGIEPEDIWRLADRYGYKVELSWAQGYTDGAFDLLLCRRDRETPEFPPTAQVNRPLSSYANNPLWHTASTPIMSELMQLCGENLPAPILPSRYLLLPTIPLTPGGKSDLRAVREMAAPRRLDQSKSTDGSILTDTERRIADVWDILLSKKGIRPHDDFFDLGGHSLLTFQLVFRLRTEFEVEVPIQMPFDASTVSEQAAVVDALLAEERRGGSVPGLIAVPRTPEVPASFAQERLWFLQQLEPASIQYNFPIFMRMRGALNTDALMTAIGDVARRHETLRTSLVAIAGRPFQSIAGEIRLHVPVIDLTGLSTIDQDAAAEAVARRQFELPFDLAAAQVFRTKLLRLAPDHHVLLLTLHHISVDAWSRSILLEELAKCYTARHEGRRADLPELPVQYADFAAWQRKLRDEGHFDTLRQYWVQQLDGIQHLPSLPTDHPRPALSAHRRTAVHFQIPVDVVVALRILCRQEDCTLFMVMVAAVYALLHRRTDRRDLVVGSDVAGRPDTAAENMVGFFVNQIVLRVDLTDHPTGRELVVRTRSAALGAYAHQDLPFEEVVKALNPKRDRNSSPLFGVQIAFDNAPKRGLVLPGLTVEPFFESIIQTVRFDIAVLLAEDDDGGGVSGTWECDAQLFDDATVQQIGQQFVETVTALAENPDQDIARADVPARVNGPVPGTEPGRRSASLKGIRPTPVALVPASLVSLKTTGEQKLPLLIQPTAADVDLVRWAATERDSLETALYQHGALLFRGFGVVESATFESFASQFVPALLEGNGEHDSTAISPRVYTPTFFPPEEKLLWHNENSFNSEGPSKIWFCCVQPAAAGGQTPIVDSREVYRQLDPGLRDEFIAKGVQYVRNYGGGFGLAWQTVFRTESRAEVEALCAQGNLLFQWRGDRLRTSAVRPAVLQHPVTHEWSWFNQAQHWHLSCLNARTRDSILATFAVDEVPRTCHFGDGSPISDDAMSEICRVYEKYEVVFNWQRGDVLMVDNILTAHARNPFQGDRNLLVAMGNLVSYR